MGTSWEREHGTIIVLWKLSLFATYRGPIWASLVTLFSVWDWIHCSRVFLRNERHMATLYTNWSPLNLPPCQSLLSCGPVKAPLQYVIQSVQLGKKEAFPFHIFTAVQDKYHPQFFLSEVKNVMFPLGCRQFCSCWTALLWHFFLSCHWACTEHQEIITESWETVCVCVHIENA